ncbi:MAG: class I SAM-dependent methyltransferase [Afipia sp.]|nr:class I SAM-dependent methyltransferase [Afipia sp.]
MIDWIRFRNTYLQMPWLFPLVIGDRHFDAVLEGRPRTFSENIQRAFEKAFWFWPRVIDATLWAHGAAGKLQTPHNFLEIDSDAKLLLDWVERVCPDRSASIFDIGCNCGRHMINLWRRGYRNITGVDAMKSALKLFADREPDIFAASEVHHDLFQRFLLKQPDRSFDLTYSHGATIELVHPSFDVVAHMCRVTKTHICLLLVPNNVFRREWIKQFAAHGFTSVHCEEPIAPDSDLSLIILRRAVSQ